MLSDLRRSRRRRQLSRGFLRRVSRRFSLSTIGQGVAKSKPSRYRRPSAGGGLLAPHTSTRARPPKVGPPRRLPSSTVIRRRSPGGVLLAYGGARAAAAGVGSRSVSRGRRQLAAAPEVRGCRQWARRGPPRSGARSSSAPRQPTSSRRPSRRRSSRQLVSPLRRSSSRQAVRGVGRCLL